MILDVIWHKSRVDCMLRALTLTLALVLLVGCKFSVTSTSTTAFFEAIEDGDIRTVRKMLGATPSLLHEKSESGFTPLMCAVSSMERTPHLVQALIDGV